MKRIIKELTDWDNIFQLIRGQKKGRRQGFVEFTSHCPRTLGISLLEIMIVLAVIALIMGLVAPRVIGTFGRAKSQTAQIQRAHIKGALQVM